MVNKKKNNEKRTQVGDLNNLDYTTRLREIGDYILNANQQLGGNGRMQKISTSVLNKTGNISLVNSYSEEDLRFEPSIGTSYINAEGETTLANYIKKYESEPQTEYDSDVNFIVFRYADVLLMLAEALGESPEAYGLINEVRNRAGLEDIDENSPGTFDEKLLHERQLELAFENHRWPDLRRFGAEREVFETAEEVVEPSDVRELFYIPQRELDINPNFTQNN